MLKIDLWKRVAIWLVVAVGILMAMPNAFYNRVEQSNDATALIAQQLTASDRERLGVTVEGLEETAATWPSALPCLLYTSPSPRDQRGSRMPSSA